MYINRLTRLRDKALRSEHLRVTRVCGTDKPISNLLDGYHYASQVVNVELEYVVWEAMRNASRVT